MEKSVMSAALMLQDAAAINHFRGAFGERWGQPRKPLARAGALMLRQAQHEGAPAPRPEPVEGRGRLRSKVETRSSLPASQNNAGKSKTPAEAGVSCSAAEAPYFSFLLEYLAASSLKALPAVKRGCRVAGLALKVVGSPVKGLVPLRALVAAL